MTWIWGTMMFTCKVNKLENMILCKAMQSLMLIYLQPT